MLLLASIEGQKGAPDVRYGRRQVATERLTASEREKLAGLYPPVCIEVEAVEEGPTLFAVRLGDVRPHPRVAATRAIADQRYKAALDALSELGGAVTEDVELLSTRMLARFGLGHLAEGEADLRALCAMAELTATALLNAYSAVQRIASVGDAKVVATRLESGSNARSRCGCRSATAGSFEIAGAENDPRCCRAVAR